MLAWAIALLLLLGLLLAAVGCEEPGLEPPYMGSRGDAGSGPKGGSSGSGAKAGSGGKGGSPASGGASGQSGSGGRAGGDMEASDAGAELDGGSDEDAGGTR